MNKALHLSILMLLTGFGAEVFAGDGRFMELRPGAVQELLATPTSSPVPLILSAPLANPRLAFPVESGVAVLDADNLVKVINPVSGEVRVVRDLGITQVKGLASDGIEFYGLTEEGLVRFDPFSTTVLLPLEQLLPEGSTLAAMRGGDGTTRIWVGAPGELRSYALEPGGRLVSRGRSALAGVPTELEPIILKGSVHLAAVMADGRLSLHALDGAPLRILAPSSSVASGTGLVARLRLAEGSGPGDQVIVINLEDFCDIWYPEYGICCIWVGEARHLYCFTW